MVINPSEEQHSSALDPQARLHRVPGIDADERLPEPTAGMVLHRVLAGAARTFLLNDMGDELIDDTTGREMVGPFDTLVRPRPVWAQSAAIELDGIQRRATQTERIHQSRVALRRIRSNVRTFRLLVDPAWGTFLRAELAWYGDRLGQARDLHIMREVITTKGPTVIDPGQVARLDEVVSARLATALVDIAAERGGARRFQLTEQMMVLWDGPAFKSKAQRPAREVMPVMLHRAWHDLRGAARTARKKPTDENLHKLRIRLKDLRYGCNTVTLVEGGPARKTAKAAERLQTRLGDLHDACYSIEWLHALADERSDLADPIDDLVTLQRDAAAQARKGWKRELKEIERRWRRWQT
jgi:CHAD domain-containing protein